MRRGPKSKYVYMAVTTDEEELPLAISESPTELARKMGVHPNTIVSAARKAELGKVKKSRFLRTAIEKD